LAFAGLVAMVTGALQDRIAGFGVMVVAAVMVLTAWVLGVAAVVLLVAAQLGTIGALLAVTGGLIVLAVLIVWLAGMRNRASQERRAATRALWVSTAVTAASALLHRDTPAAGVADDPGAAPTSHRSAWLVVGGLALLILAFLFPSAKDQGPDNPV
jgi:hypothetical protein